jgi:hypothetical protein
MIENYDRILEWVNSVRAIYGAPPLTEICKGTPRQGSTCPLAESLKCPEYGVYDVIVMYDETTIYVEPRSFYSGKGVVERYTVVNEELEEGKPFMYLLVPTPDFISEALQEIDLGHVPELMLYPLAPIDIDDEYEDEEQWEFPEYFTEEDEEDFENWEEGHGNDYWDYEWEDTWFEDDFWPK